MITHLYLGPWGRKVRGSFQVLIAVAQSPNDRVEWSLLKPNPTSNSKPRPVLYLLSATSTIRPDCVLSSMLERLGQIMPMQTRFIICRSTKHKAVVLRLPPTL
jgi:hypothetical protein